MKEKQKQRHTENLTLIRSAEPQTRVFTGNLRTAFREGLAFYT